ncbi:MAG: hypothetical protein ACR5K4_01280 [Sodalis sp. (in: enterobacteria)]
MRENSFLVLQEEFITATVVNDEILNYTSVNFPAGIKQIMPVD